MRVVRTLLLASIGSLASLAGGCSADEAPVPEAGSPIRVEYALVCNPAGGVAPDSTVPYLAETIALGPRREAHFLRVQLAPDEKGFPAIAFVLVAPEAAEFRRWTGEHVGEPLAYLFDGEIVSIATIFAPLLGSGRISMPEGTSLNEVRSRIARIPVAR